MRYLFVHQNFPAQYLHLLRHLASAGEHELLFITENARNHLPGVRKLVHSLARAPARGVHRDTLDFELAMLRASAVGEVGRRLRTLGFVPDVIIGHHGWGELLNLPDVWPKAPLIGYLEFYYQLHGTDVNFDPEFPIAVDMFSRIRAKNAVNLLALGNPGIGQTPTAFQRSTYPDWAQPKIALLREGVDLDVCKPNPALRTRTVSIAGYKIAPADRLITYVARDLEPYRGFHIVMRALPKVLAARPDARVILVGGDAVSYGVRPEKGTWREKMQDEIASRVDLSRVHFAGRVPYETYIKILQRSDAHVYLTYPFVASWSLREALGAGCAVVGSDTAPVREFVTDRQTGLLAPFLKPDAVADGILEMLEDTAAATRMRATARAWAEKHLDLQQTLRDYDTLIKTSIAGGALPAPLPTRPLRRAGATRHRN